MFPLEFINETIFIAMRDKIKLHTIVFRPTDTQTKLGTVLIRTPYGVGSEYSDCSGWVSLGFNCVIQDFRGRYQSQGKFEFFRNTSNDGYDTMQYIV